MICSHGTLFIPIIILYSRTGGTANKKRCTNIRLHFKILTLYVSEGF